jgi:hypothetical protein
MKNIQFVMVAAFAAALASAAFSTRGVEAQGFSSDVRRGFEVAPVPLNMSGKNPALVGQGSYLVNAQAGCNDCHSTSVYAAGGDPFKGEPEQVNAAEYLAGGRAFGPFTSRNLTPRGNGRPAGLTLAQFVNAMRTGVDIKNGHPQISPLLQVMPWPVYSKLSDRELEAIYEYLSAIPCLGSAARCATN